MNKAGPIIVIEDDLDDQLLLEMVFDQLKFGNEIVYFSDGASALDYLQRKDTYPFLILSDINLPKLNGFELRKMIHTNEGLSEKCIPYLFFSTAANRKDVFDAYTMSVQGFFIKPSEFEQLKATIQTVIEYWKECYSPGNYK